VSDTNPRRHMLLKEEKGKVGRKVKGPEVNEKTAMLAAMSTLIFYEFPLSVKSLTCIFSFVSRH